MNKSIRRVARTHESTHVLLWPGSPSGSRSGRGRSALEAVIAALAQNCTEGANWLLRSADPFLAEDQSGQSPLCMVIRVPKRIPPLKTSES